VVETAFPNADTATKQWINGASIIGVNNSVSGSSLTASANQIRLRSYTAPANMTLNSIAVFGNANSGSLQLRAVVYASTATGAALLASGPIVTGITSGSVTTMPLTTPLVLTGGTTYAIGCMSDVILTNAFGVSDGLSAGFTGTATFASGAPATLPAVSASQSFQCWGNCTGAAADWPSLAINPPVDDSAYIWESTVGDEELFAFPALATAPASVACVVIKARLKRSDAGSRTVDVRCKSGAADTAGTAASVTPGSSYTWVGNYLPTDPATGLAWTGTAVNAAQAGVKVAS
jgi:hypothetical protein